MTKDDRAVLSGIRTTIEKMGDPIRVLGDNDVDEIAGMYSQDELNRMVNDGILAGNWTSTKKDVPADQDKSAAGEPSRQQLEDEIAELRRQLEQKTESTAAFPADYPGFEVLGQVENMNRAKLEAMTDAQILDINGIGPATLKLIRAYGK